MSFKEPEKTGTVSLELDSKRAEMLQWAIEYRFEEGKHSSSHLNNNQPLSASLIRGIMNRIYQWSKVKFYDPNTGYKDKDGIEIVAPIERPFNPKTDWILDIKLKCPLAKEIVDNWLASTKAVSGKRATLVLETMKDIGRPQQNVFSQLAGIMGKKDEEYTEEE